jgi:hypothetical protein
MGLKTGGYATIWSVETKGKYAKVKLTTSKKNKETEQYETDFSSFVIFVGEANTGAGKLKEKDRIKIGDFEVTNKYDKDKKITYTNYAVFSFEMADGSGKAATPKKAEKPVEENVPDSSNDELPW